MLQIKCTLCNREVLTDEEIVRFTSWGKEKTVPSTCWTRGGGFCQAKEVNPDPVQLEMFPKETV